MGANIKSYEDRGSNVSRIKVVYGLEGKGELSGGTEAEGGVESTLAKQIR